MALVPTLLREAMAAADVVFDIEPKVDALVAGRIAVALARSGKVPAAIEAAANIRDANLKRATLSDVAVAQAQTGDIGGGVQAAEQMERPRWKARTLATIVEVIMKAGK